MAALIATESAMKTMSARDAKNGLGLMIDTALAEPVLIQQHGRGVVVVVSVEELARLNDAASAMRASMKTTSNVQLSIPAAIRSSESIATASAKGHLPPEREKANDAEYARRTDVA